MQIDAGLTKLSDVPGAIAVSPSGHHVYVAYPGRAGSMRARLRGTVAVVDPWKLAEIARIRVGRAPSAIAVEPSGERIFVANRLSHDLSVIDTRSLSEAARIPIGRHPADMTGDADRLYVAHDRPGALSVIDMESMRVVSSVTVGRPPRSLTLGPTGDRLFACFAADGTVAALDTQTLTTVATTKVGDRPVDMALDDDGCRLFVANLVAQSISVVDTETFRTTRTMQLSTLSRRSGVGLFRDPVSPQPWAVGVSADGSRLLVAFWEAGTLAVLDADSGAPLSETQLDTAEYSIGPQRIVADRRGKRLYVACADHALVGVRDIR